jgi:phosphotransferase family enzyme
LADLLTRVDIAALKSAASAARNGIGCHISALDDDRDDHSRLDLVSSQCGGQNCHVDVEFDDGVTWIARIRLRDPLLPPADVQDHIFLSEVATLQFLARTAVPVPRVHCYQSDGLDNVVGTSYVLMDKLPGRPLDWYKATQEQQLKVMEQLADIFIEFERYPFHKTGSLVLSPAPDASDVVKVGGYAQLPWFETAKKTLGPFGSLDAAYTAVLGRHLDAIGGYEMPSLSVDNYLSFKWRLENVPVVISSSTSRDRPFFLKH